jgi:hypothetical protein
VKQTSGGLRQSLVDAAGRPDVSNLRGTILRPAARWQFPANTAAETGMRIGVGAESQPDGAIMSQIYCFQ